MNNKWFNQHRSQGKYILCFVAGILTCALITGITGYYRVKSRPVVRAEYENLFETNLLSWQVHAALEDFIKSKKWTIKHRRAAALVLEGGKSENMIMAQKNDGRGIKFIWWQERIAEPSVVVSIEQDKTSEDPDLTGELTVYLKNMYGQRIKPN